MRPAAPHAGFCRLTVLAPRARVDVSLPADVPVAELVPMVLELVGEPVFGLRPEPWRLSGAAGGPLPPGATLAQLGVPDGELLRLAPAAPPPPPPVFDDPVDALAATAGGSEDRRFAAAAVLSVAVAAAGLLALRPGGTLPAVVAGLGAAVAVAAAARLARRAAAVSDPHHLHLAARTAAVTAVPLAAAAGWAVQPASPGVARLLLAVAAAGTVAALAQVALRVVAPLLIGAVVSAVPVGLGALAVLRFDAPVSAVAAGVCAVALAAGPLLPRIALRLAGTPRPVVPGDGTELVDADGGADVLPPAEFAERADLARGYLAGLVGGCAVVAAGAALPAAAGGEWAGPVLAGVAAVVLALRARSYADPAPARTLLAAAVAAVAGLGWLVALRTGPAGQPVAGGALLVVALVGTGALAGGRRAGSPVVRRALDLMEGVLIAAAIPLALAAMDLFRLVREL
jgi:type VII secretion integral membrane protein EccD